MKKIFGIFLAALLYCMFAQSALALPSQVYLVNINTSTSGGAFEVWDSSTDSFLFNTFCLEKNEFFTPYTNYYVEYDSAAKLGGVGGASNGEDPLDGRTAWVYNKYYDNGLYSSGWDDNDVQDAIWYLEDEIELSDDQIGNNLVLKESLSGVKNGSALVMNLWKNYDASNGFSGKVQSQLAPVPEPATILLLGLGLIGIAGASRKKFKK